MGVETILDVPHLDAPKRGAPEPDAKAFDARAFQVATQANADQMADMESFRILLGEWSRKINLVGPSAMEAFWLRHAWDSAQLMDAAPNAKVWADIGAGAGFPGLVLAILFKTTAGAKVHLIESMSKRCRFLSEVVQRLDLPAEIHNARAEDMRLDRLDVVTARACAPLGRLLQFAEPLLTKGAVGLFLKGEGIDAELAEARKTWRFQSQLLPSRSAASGRILKVESLSRA